MTRSTLLGVAAVTAVLVIGVVLLIPRFGSSNSVGSAASNGPSAPIASTVPSPSPSFPAGSPSLAATANATPIPLTSSFVSRRYGYTIAIAPTWTSTPATKPWVGPNNAPPAVDQMAATGTDTAILGGSQPLAVGQTFDEWLALFHSTTGSSVPPGCDGGDPSTWPVVVIGGKPGRWQQLCNAADAVVEVGDRVYAFAWSNATFNGKTHLSVDDFKRMLETVTFQPVQ